MTLAPIAIPSHPCCPCPSEIRTLVPEYLAAPSIATEVFPSSRTVSAPFLPAPSPAPPSRSPLLSPEPSLWRGLAGPFRQVAGQSMPGGGEQAFPKGILQIPLWGTSFKDLEALES